MTQKDEQNEEWKGISRALYALAKADKLSEEQAFALSQISTTVDQLRRARPSPIAEVLDVSEQKATELIQAACLTILPNVSPEFAVEMVKLGLDLESFAEARLDDLFEKFRDFSDVTMRQVAAWSVSASAYLLRGKPQHPTEIQPPKLIQTPIVRRSVLEKDMTWQEVARDFYTLDGTTVKEWASTLAAGNRSRSNLRQVAGTVLLLPETNQAKAKLQDINQSVASLQSFAPYLTEKEAHNLVEAGITSLNALPFISHSSSLDDFGIGKDQLRKLQTQVQLATLPGISPELAYYLAAVKGNSLQDIAKTNPVDMSADMTQDQALGYLDKSVDVSVIGVSKWLGVVATFGNDPLGGTGGTVVGEATICKQDVPATSHLENYYTYRFAAAGKTAEDLRLEIDAKNQWLTLVDDYRTSTGINGSKTQAFMENGLSIAHIHMDETGGELKQWGGIIWDMTNLDTLLKLHDFMRDNVKVIELIQTLTEGHEAYRHREYGLALSAYDRAENWFSSIAPPQNPPSIDEKWWRNEQDTAGGGTYKPSFLVKYEHSPTDGEVLHNYKPVHEYYLSRQSASDRNTLLETLHTDWPDYSKWRLDADISSSSVPFRKFLYYVYNFMIPMLKADCYARLGNYCAALDNYFRVHQIDSFTKHLDTVSENNIVSVIGDPMTSRYPALVPFTVTTLPQAMYYEPYLNKIEKDVVRLKIAETLLSWADLHFRRNEIYEAQARYAQVIRIFYSEWDSLRAIQFTDLTAYSSAVESSGINPRVIHLALSAHHELLKIANDFNYLGYSEDYVPIWTYNFLLSSARYLAERARQLGRDALQFLNSAEQEQGNRHLLLQSVAVTQGQLALEARKVDESIANSQVAQAGSDLADQRIINNNSRKEELEAFGPTRQALGIVGGAIGGASSGASIGGASGGAMAAEKGGPYGAAIGATIGAGYGAISSYISGCIEMQSQRNELERQRLESEKAKAMSQAEVNRAQIGVSVAWLSRNIAALNTIFAQSNLDYAQAKTLNAEFWFETSARLADMATNYLERAIGLSFMAEQAFEFMEGRRLDIIRFDYSQSEGVLSADALLSDLDSIEYERVSGRLNKTMPVKQVFTLREKDFYGFAEFKRIGTMTFDTSLFNFDMSHPGAYHQRIASVELEVRALVPPEGISGTLSKSGLSYLRYPVSDTGTAPPPNTTADWIEHTPTNFRMAPVIQSDETLILSPFDVRRDSVILRPDPGENLRVFEGSGVATIWTLSLRPCSNKFDFSTITDVNLIVYYYSQFDEQLERAVNLERRKLFSLGELIMQQSQGFSLREMFPDEMYHLQNPSADSKEDPWQLRTLNLDIDPAFFPPNQRNRRLQGITLAFVGKDRYLDVRTGLSTSGFDLTTSDFQVVDDAPNVRAALGYDHSPEGFWQLNISAANNVGFWTLPGIYQVGSDGKVVLDAKGQPVPNPLGLPVFDPEKVALIEDIWLIFNYKYDEGGECGEALLFWAHFWDTDKAYFVDHNTKILTAWLQDLISFRTSVDVTGLGSFWTMYQGRMSQFAYLVETILTPTTILDWKDVDIIGQVFLPPAELNSVGLAFRYHPPKDGLPRGDYYLVRLTRLADDKLEVALDVQFNDSLTTLKNVEFRALAAMTDFELSVRAKADQLEVSLNRKMILKVNDSKVASGSIGLYANGSGMGFGEVLVSDLTYQ